MTRVIGFYVGVNQSFTGGPRTTFNLVRTLDRDRYFPVVITNKESEFSDKIFGLGLQPIVLHPPDRIGDADRGTLTGSVLRKFAAVGDVLKYNRLIATQLRSHGVELLWTRNVKGVLLAGLAAKKMNIPLVWDIGMEKPSRGIVRHLHNFAFRLADQVVTQGESVQRSVFERKQVARFEHKICTIESGVADDRISKSKRREIGEPPWDPFRIVCVGTLNRRKNQLLLLSAFSRIAERFPAMTIRFVGPSHDAEYRAEILDFISEKRLSNRVELLGWRDDVEAILAESHLFVLTSDVEGVPQALLEAMKACVPAIATSAGGVPDVIDDGRTGWIVPVGDAESLSKRLAYCATNQHVLPEIALAGAEHVIRHRTVESWSASYQALFDRLLEKRVEHCDGRETDARTSI